MHRSRRVLAPLAVLASLAACSSVRPAPDEPVGASTAPAAEGRGGPKEEKKESRSLLVGLLLYVPNRVMDVLDVVRFGVEAGPGIGVDLQATAPVSVVAMTRTYVGVGYQTLRHSPVAAGAETGIGVGPATLMADLGGWHRAFADVRVGLHLAVVGAHVAVEPVEIVDAVLGLAGIDIRDDDF